MMLTDAEIDSIAHRVVQLLAERLSNALPSLPAPPIQSRVEPQEKESEISTARPLSYTLKQLSKEIGLSQVSIYRLEARGLIKSVPGIRRKLYALSEVERFLAGNQGNWRLK